MRIIFTLAILITCLPLDLKISYLISIKQIWPPRFNLQCCIAWAQLSSHVQNALLTFFFFFRSSTLMASTLVKALRVGQRGGVLLEQASKAVCVAPQHGDLHTSSTVQGVLTMPERLQHIPDAAVRTIMIYQNHYHLLLYFRTQDSLRWWNISSTRPASWQRTS